MPGKKLKAAAALIDRNKRYTVDEAVVLLKKVVETRKVRFDETVNIAINLGVDPKHADQMVRGAVVLPNGTGRSARVAVFAKGDKANEAQAAGADVVAESVRLPGTPGQEGVVRNWPLLACVSLTEKR